MSGIVLLVAIFIVFAIVLGVIAFVAYRRVLRKAKNIERGLKMVPLLIHLPPPSDDSENTGSRDESDIMRAKISEAKALYELIAGTAQAGFKSKFYGQRHIAFEVVASGGLVHYFAAVPIALVSVVEQAIVTAYPGARLEEVEDHNIFNPQGHLTGTVGGELVLKHEAAYPIATMEQMEKDPMSGLINALYKLQLGEGAAVQIMLRPANPGWTKRAEKLVAKKRNTKQGGLGFGALDIAKATVKTPEEWREEAKSFEPSKLEEQMMQAIEEKTKHPAYEVLVRVLASSASYDRSQVILRNLTTSFALFEAPGSNGFQFIEGRDMQGLVTAFIFRFFPPEISSSILNSVELATLFHLPDAQFTPTTQVERQQSKQVDGPVSMPQTGLLTGYNFYRGVKKEIRLSPEDRRRHTYIVGQTGTGKSTILENLAVQDMLAGNGFAFIDPHGDTAEKLLSMVPKERAEDVVYFNPGDMEHPLGLNIFEFNDPQQKDFLIQESINMLYKLYDPGKTGIIGPRFEHWYRNAALTLMADPDGSSFIEIPKVFTDSAYLKNKFKYLKDPTVIDFWTKEMGQTSDYHKSEMLGWFVSKFGAFQSNEMMRNIIGQTKSAFNLRDIMDNKKILIVNLGKGRVGELNAQLLGMIFVIKFQAAAMSRSDVPEDQRQDFCLYVDEFQNFSTDSFASILSEARKYRLNLIVANQFIGQLSDEIRDAVFGNVGTMLSFRTGPEDAEFLVKQFEPTFDQRDMVNLPNYNAVMKLLIGGLPSLPFSITMLPPLGQAHAEMGLAIKQLSAAKFGVPRAQVEADIFGRLQNQPKTVVPNAATASLAPAPAAPAPAPAPQPTTPAATIPPSQSIPASAPTPPTAPPPVAQPQPSAPQPVPQPHAVSPSPADAPPVVPAPESTAPAPKPAAPQAEAHEDMLPQATAASTLAPAMPAPEPKSPVNPSPAPLPAAETPDSLSIASFGKGIAPTSAQPSPSDTAVAPPAPAPAKTGSSIHDVVGGAPMAKPEPTPSELLIEAHEEDGIKNDAPPPSAPPKAPPKAPSELLIEAHEEDGRRDEPKAEAPAPVVAEEPMEAPATEVVAPTPTEPASAPVSVGAESAPKPAVQFGPKSEAKLEPPAASEQQPTKTMIATHRTPPTVTLPAPAAPKAPAASQPEPTTGSVATATATIEPPRQDRQSPSEEKTAPNLQPGEVYVDEHGNIVKG